MSIAVRFCPNCHMGHGLTEPMCTACGTSLSPTSRRKPCRFLFVHVESLLNKKAESGSEALSTPMAFPQMQKIIQEVYHQQAIDTTHQWRVVFYTSYSEPRRDQVVAWLNEQRIWTPDALLVMRDPSRFSNSRWARMLIHEVGAMLGANTLHDCCILFDLHGQDLQDEFTSADEMYRIPYAPVVVCDSPKAVRDALKD